ncbi:MAG: PTS fructose transporter subunit IIA [Coriobacteriales bacterium]|nr:PTS fructose transporter subunit IIA [Coriobacteriales bacterium]
MRYLLLVGHAKIASGLQSALEMLLGPREFIRSCGMEEGMGPEGFCQEFKKLIADIAAEDQVVLLADIAGGSPQKNALSVLDNHGLGNDVIVFGGANLAMAITAVMGLEDGLELDVIRDAMLSEGAQSVRQI